MDLAVEMSDLFRALGDPTRSRIVYALVQQDLTTSRLAELLGLSAPSVSQHLRTLRLLRVVRSRREGQLVFYSVDDEHVRQLVTVVMTHLGELRAPDRTVR